MRSRFSAPPAALKPTALLLTIAFGGAANVAHADGAAALADGAVWEMRNANGRTGTLILNPDGSGQMSMGLVTLRLRWDAAGDDLCIDTAMRGRQCSTLVPDGAGFVGVQEGAAVFWLARSDG